MFNLNYNLYHNENYFEIQVNLMENSFNLLNEIISNGCVTIVPCNVRLDVTNRSPVTHIVPLFCREQPQPAASLLGSASVEHRGWEVVWEI